MAVGFSAVDDDLYRELILEHFRHPRHQGEVEDADHVVDGNNPLCGDEVRLSWKAADGRLEPIGFVGKGCSISLASASMLCDAVSGANVEAARETARRFRAMLLEGGPVDSLGDLEALRGVASYPARIKCAVLPWNALLQGLDEGAITGDEAGS